MTDSPGKTLTHPIFIVTGGRRDGAVLLLNEAAVEKRIGSAPDADLCLEANNIDRYHLRAVWDGSEGLLVTDLGSATGTYVNGERIGANHPLQDADRVCLGPPGSRHSVKLLVRVSSAAPESATAAASDLEPKGIEIFAPPPTALEPVEPAPTPPPPNVIPPLPPPTLPVGFTAPVGSDLQLEDEPLVLSVEPPAAVFAPPIPPPAPASPIPPPAPPPPTSAPHEARPEAPPPPPLPLIPPPGTAAKPIKRSTDLLTELPSIVDERRREPEGLPWLEEEGRPPVKKARGGRLPGPLARIPRPLLVAGGSAVLGVTGFLIYGSLTAPPPALSGLTPPKLEPGQTLTINGASFAGTPGANTVRFGEQVAIVTSASATQLAVFVPDGLASEKPEDVPVSVENRHGRSNSLLLRVRRLPRLQSIEPPVALPGAEVLLKGQNLDATPLSIEIASQKAEVREAQPTQIRAVVPDLRLAEGTGVPVVVRVGDEPGRPVSLVLGKLPLLTGLQPVSGQAGDKVSLKGFGFDPNPAGNAVEFGGEPALVLAASDKELVVAAPHPSAAGSRMQVQVVVKAKGGTSSGSTFTLLRSSGGMFIPRFFPAPLPDAPDRAAVATELGPVLLLTSRDDAPSTAERASRVATALNNAFGNASTAFELREGPQPGIGIVGGSLLLRASAEDTAAYASAKGGRPGSRALAAYWTALLQDLHMLFVRHQRPTRVVEVSPRGRVLLDLFSESERRGGGGGGGGVAASLVDPPSPSLAKAFREMTTQLSEGGGSAGAAVAGRWFGAMNEEGVDRSLQVTLRLEGSQLVGSLTTKSGQISMEVPLQDVSYAKGVLSFSISGGAALRRFRGTLQGSEISGVIQGPSGGDPVGQFSLRYAE